MANLSDVREQVASAVASAGWNVYRQIPDTINRYPFAIVSIQTVEYTKVYSGIITANVSMAIDIYASASNLGDSQDLIDAAMSYGTENSIPTALTNYDSYTDVIAGAVVQGAEGFTLVQINEQIAAYCARLNLIINTKG